MHPLFHKADQLSHTAIGAAIEVHRELGPGLLESAYEACLVFELVRRGLKVEKQKIALLHKYYFNNRYKVKLNQEMEQQYKRTTYYWISRGIRVERQFCRNTNTTSATRITASTSV